MDMSPRKCFGMADQENDVESPQETHCYIKENHEHTVPDENSNIRFGNDGVHWAAHVCIFQMSCKKCPAEWYSE